MLSVVVVVYNMRREAPRTLHSLAVPYQRRVVPEDYEVIVVDNGSTEPLERGLVESFGPGFRYFYRETDSASPAEAVNFGVRQARHDDLGLFVDGARIASPGLLDFARRGLALAERPLVAALAWHLGPELQSLAVARGYDREVEEGLLQRSGWTSDGYNLFSISTLAVSSREGYFHAPSESNALFLHRSLFDELGGFDERFVSIGGGFVNGDFFVRACAAEGTELVMLLGEGTFHQVHGGAATNATGALGEERARARRREYEAIRNLPFAPPQKSATYLGTLPPQACRVLEHSVRRIAAREESCARTPVRVPVLFCVDCENDATHPERSDRSPWTRLERCFERLGEFRAKLAEATESEARFNWMVRADPQLAEIYGDSAWGLVRYERTWRELLQRGDEVGLHPHPQRWSEEEARWIGGQERPGWAKQVLRVAHQDYVRVLGRPPATLRFGNRFMSQDLAELAEELGFRYDLTVEPGYPGRTISSRAYRHASVCPSYFEAPREPYHPARHDFLTPDPERSSGLWFVPMSAAPVSRGAPRSHRSFHRAVSPDVYPYETLHLRLAPELLRRAVDHLLEELGRPYLAVVIRCDMIELSETWSNLEALRTHPWVWNFEFTTPERALRMLGYEREAGLPWPHQAGEVADDRRQEVVGD